MWEILSTPSLWWFLIGQTFLDVAVLIYVVSQGAERTKLMRQHVALHRIVDGHVAWARDTDAKAISHAILTNRRLQVLEACMRLLPPQERN